jgi:hypothetical protein
MRMGLTNCFLVIALATSLTCALQAQTTTSGALNGVVIDQTNAVVPSAEVEIKDLARGTTQSTKTDREGLYQFFFLVPSKYRLFVTHDGFREERRTVEVLLGPPVTVNISLQIATISSEIKVTDEVPFIQAENGDVAATVSTKQISETPNPGNDLTNIVQITPGVVMNTDNNGGVAFSILGMPGNSYFYTIDGISDTDNSANQQLTGSLGLLLGKNQVEEASVVTTGYSGQFGGAAGGNINYVTKSGTSQLHGNAQYYWNGRILNANDWFIKATGGERPFNVVNQWAGSLGGPIKKDKIFFFYDNEGLRVLYPQTVPVQVPSLEFEAATLANIDSIFGVSSASDKFYRQVFDLYNTAPGLNFAKPGAFGDALGCSGFQDPNTRLGISVGGNPPVPCARYFFQSRTRPSQDMLNSGRVDWNINNRDRAFIRLQYDGGHSSVGADSISPVFDVDGTIQWWQGQIVETHSFGSSGASQFLLADSSYFNSRRFLHPDQALSALPTRLSFSAQGTFTDLGTDTPSGGGVYSIPWHFQVSEDLVKTWRNHKIGFGGNLEVIKWDVGPYAWGVNGTVSPQTLDAFYQGGQDSSSADVDFTQLSQNFSTATWQQMNFHSFGLYAQDEWQARKNLSFTLALRAEHQSNPSCESGCFPRLSGSFESVSHDPNQPYNQAIVVNQKQAFLAMDKVLWSPRLGFAWQPFGASHGMVLRGGLGVFYDSVSGDFPYSFSFNPPLWNSYRVAGDNLSPGEITNLFKDAAASNAAFVNGFKSGQTLAQIQQAVSSVSPTGFSPPGIFVADGVTRSPQYQKWSLEVQQVLGVHSSLKVGYFGHHGIYGLIFNPSANAWGFGTLPTSLCSSPPVPPCADPRFGGVLTLSSGAISSYHGMVASFQHKFSGWTPGLLQVNYTFGHALDEISNGALTTFTGDDTLSAQDPKNLRRSYGPADYDVRHSLNANYVWELPVKAALHGHGPNSLVTGWQVSGTVFFHSPYPYSAFDDFESGLLQEKNYFGSIYAVPVGPLGKDPPCGRGAAFTNPVNPCQPVEFFIQPDGTMIPNPNARFVQAGCETGFDVGNLGVFPACNGPAVSFVQSRNRFRGLKYFNTDFNIMKNTKLPGWEDASLGIGLQFFNVLNHPSFGLPINGIEASYFGQICCVSQAYTSIFGNNTGANASRRLIQVKAQLQF